LNTTPLHCAHCGAPLDALTRRRGRGQPVGRRAQQLAAQQPETGAVQAPLLQLESTGCRLVPVTETDRAFLAARWRAAHPGATLDEAIAEHMDWLPSEHVDGQCAYQTAHGCALPRERRADICNVYRCPALATQVALQPDAAAVVLTRDGRRLQQAVVFRRGRATPLAGVPQPDDLPA